MGTTPDSLGRAELLDELYQGLTTRRTVEDVAALLVGLEIHDLLSVKNSDSLTRAATYANQSWMPRAFRRHPGLDAATAAAVRAVSAVSAAAGTGQPASPDAQDPASLKAYVDASNTLLGLGDTDNPARNARPAGRYRANDYGWHPTRDGGRGRRGDTAGHADPRSRLNAQERRAALPGVSVRTYRRAVRAVNHLEQRTGVLANERAREGCISYAKTRLASTIDHDQFVAHARTAAFVAYYTARLARRTVFTNESQSAPMDTVAENLLAVALADPGCKPAVIARVLTTQVVLDRLTDAQKADLLTATWEQLTTAATLLRGAHDPGRDLTRMVARPGDDASTWNAASRAFNQARTGWLNLTKAMSLEALSEASCPGKVPALVAADVAHWHDLSGSSAHVDTLVFTELPLPWDVVLSAEPCTADLVRLVCSRHDVDADKDGWTQPFAQRQVEEPSATPELVHGVAVGSPQLAAVLRASGLWSGRPHEPLPDGAAPAPS